MQFSTRNEAIYRIFWAQALDNISPDIVQDSNILLSTNDIISYNACSSAISKVTSRGKKYCFREHLTIYRVKDSYVLYCPTTMIDSEGRTSIIACYFRMDRKQSLEKQAEFLFTELREFANKIEWKIEEQELTQAYNELLTIASTKTTLFKRILKALLVFINIFSG